MSTDKEPIQACPKCGGTNGYEGILVMHYTMTGAWGKEWECSGMEHAVYRSPTMKCSDCGTRVDRLTSMGIDPDDI